MLPLTFGLLLLAGSLGGLLATLHGRASPAAIAAWPVGILHGLFGSIGLIALVFALRGPPHGAAAGVAGFGRIAAVLLAAALMASLPLVLARLRRRPPPGLLIGVHASLAISGIVLLAAYTFVG